jgi:hypothetical protein
MFQGVTADDSAGHLRGHGSDRPPTSHNVKYRCKDAALCTVTPVHKMQD